MVRYLRRSILYTQEAADKAQLRISELKQAGKDVEPLEDAMDAYYTLISEADQAQDAAESLITLHDGFDENGKVIDLEKARLTIVDIAPQVEIVRKNIIEVMRVIFNAIKTYQDL